MDLMPFSALSPTSNAETAIKSSDCRNKTISSISGVPMNNSMSVVTLTIPNSPDFPIKNRISSEPIIIL